jgi:hypothetical protein
VRAIECVVADLLHDQLTVARGELVDDLPAPRRAQRVLGPDLELQIAGIVGVLAEDDAHLALAREVKQPADLRHRAWGVLDLQRALVAHEVVLHVDDDQRGARRVEREALVDLVLGICTVVGIAAPLGSGAPTRRR